MTFLFLLFVRLRLDLKSSVFESDHRQTILFADKCGGERMGWVGDGPVPPVPHACACMCRDFLSSLRCCHRLLIRILLTEAANIEGIEKVFDKFLWTINYSV